MMNLTPKLVDEFTQKGVSIGELIDLGRLIKNSEIELNWNECRDKPPLPHMYGTADLLKPENIKGTKKFRYCKDEVYRNNLSLVQATGVIRGKAVTLGAAYAPEIQRLFSLHISGSLVTCEKDRKSARELSEYYWKVDQRRPGLVEFRRQNVFKYLEQATDLTLIDLDFMGKLTLSTVDTIATLLQKCTKQEFCISIWSNYGRTCGTQDDYDYLVRPYIVWKLANSKEAKFSLISSVHYKYNDNHHPMKVETLVLEHRTYTGNPAC